MCYTWWMWVPHDLKKLERQKGILIVLILPPAHKLLAWPDWNSSCSAVFDASSHGSNLFELWWLATTPRDATLLRTTWTDSGARFESINFTISLTKSCYVVLNHVDHVCSPKPTKHVVHPSKDIRYLQCVKGWIAHVLVLVFHPPSAQPWRATWEGWGWDEKSIFAICVMNPSPALNTQLPWTRHGTKKAEHWDDKKKSCRNTSRKDPVS